MPVSSEANTVRAEIPAGDDLALLMRCHGLKFKRGGAVTRELAPPSAADIAEATTRGWAPMQRLQLGVSDYFDRLAAALERLDRTAVMAAFVAGIGGSAPRGRQIPISWAWATTALEALGVGRLSTADLGVGASVEIDYVRDLVSLALGNAWNERPQRFLPDLEAAAVQGLPEPTPEDRRIFGRMIAALQDQPAGLTPGQLEKALATLKLLPGTDKYQRYGVLQALAELGVLPNPHLPPALDRAVAVSERHAAERLVPGGSRSDIVLPLSGWRSELGLDRVRLDLLFGDFL